MLTSNLHASGERKPTAPVVPPTECSKTSAARHLWEGSDLIHPPLFSTLPPDRIPLVQWNTRLFISFKGDSSMLILPTDSRRGCESSCLHEASPRSDANYGDCFNPIFCLAAGEDEEGKDEEPVVGDGGLQRKLRKGNGGWDGGKLRRKCVRDKLG